MTPRVITARIRSRSGAYGISRCLAELLSVVRPRFGGLSTRNLLVGLSAGALLVGLSAGALLVGLSAGALLAGLSAGALLVGLSAGALLVGLSWAGRFWLGSQGFRSS